MSETERPGAPGDDEHETSKPHPTVDDVPTSPSELTEDDDERGEDEGPEVDQLDEDPAYEPDDPGLKGIKGG